MLDAVTPRQKQSRQREDESSPPKPQMKRSRVAHVKHSAVPLMEDHILYFIFILNMNSSF